jgi:signal transduction histidine kinase/ActR/RegA family two-component response regulator
LRGRTIGALTFAAAETGSRYGAADLRLAEDVAHRVFLAIENAGLYQALQEADRRKDEFLATLSHELRSPLNAIVGWAHLLRAGGADEETVRKGAETIHRNAQAQARLISDILDVSRIVAGKMRLDVRPVELQDVVEAALETARPAAEAKGIRLEVERGLAPGSDRLSADPDRLQQVLWNLLSNAIKFSPMRVGRVVIRLESVEGRVLIMVEDNGPGIDPSFLPHIFERFRQAESSSNRRHRGLGLGLAIVRSLVELHGGTVQAANREGSSGSVFTIELPRRVATTGPLPALERHPRGEEALWLEAAPSLAGLRILVVDDEPEAREMLRIVLERCGAQVVAAPSAREGLEALQSHRPHVLIADVGMPEENGYDLLRWIRALPPERGGLTPAAALTAYASAQDRVNALRAGFQIHLCKPIQPAELAAVVSSLSGSLLGAR